MRKNWLLVSALLSYAVGMGCSANGNGAGPGGVNVSVNPAAWTVGVTLTKKFTANVTGTSNQAVTWSLSQNNSPCSPGCGSIAADGTYTAPGTVPSAAKVTLTATSQDNHNALSSATITIVDITVNMTPTPVTVGLGLQQQFTARAIPDDPNAQPVTWQLVGCNANDCGTLDPNTCVTGSSICLYTAPGTLPSEKSFQVQATSTVDPNNGTVGSAMVSVASRIPNGSYTFNFSGYDNSGGAIAVVGSFVSNGDGSIKTGGVQDVISMTGGGPATYAITGGSYVFTVNSSDPASNNHGSITLAASGFTRTYNMVLDSGGDIQIVENDGNGTGSGAIQVATPGNFNMSNLAYTFVFGLSGTDVKGKRVGCVSLLPVDGTGKITNGLLDINEGGTASSASDITGTLSVINGIGTLSVTSASLGNTTYDFEIYGVSGTNKANNPLTMVAVSTDPIDSMHPALSGTLIYQDSTVTYDKTALNKNATEIANLTGVDTANGGTTVSLAFVGPDGNGNDGGSFDQNDAGKIVSAQSFGGCTYAPTGSNAGRYTIKLFGDSSCNNSTAFVLYLRGANRGFLLDQSSAAVMTGSMDQVKTKQVANSDMEGAFALGTVSSAASSVMPTVANLLFNNYPASGAPQFTGTTYPGAQALTGTTYAMQAGGDGTVTVTQPANATYVIYALDPISGSNTQVAHFWMMDGTSGNKNPSLWFGQR